MSENSIAVSVIVPVYNTEPYLRECLDSIVNQTLKKIEILLINDGSTDGSLAIMQEYAKKDPRITLFDGPNRGTGAARNIGLDAAQGEYLSFLDSDDFFELNMLELSYKKAKGEDAELVGFNWITYNNQTKETETIFGNLDTLPAWNKLIKRDFIKKYHIEFQNIKINNDNFFSLAVRYASKKSFFINNALCYHRININNTSSTRYKYSKCAIEAAKKTKEFLIANDLYKANKKHFYTILFKNFAAEGTHCLAQNPDKAYFEDYIQEAINFLPCEYHQLFFEEMKARYNSTSRKERERDSQRMLALLKKYHCSLENCHFEFKRDIFHYVKTPYIKELCIAWIRVYRKIKTDNSNALYCCGLGIFKIKQDNNERYSKKKTYLFGIPIYSKKKEGYTVTRCFLFLKFRKTNWFATLSDRTADLEKNIFQTNKALALHSQNILSVQSILEKNLSSGNANSAKQTSYDITGYKTRLKRAIHHNNGLKRALLITGEFSQGESASALKSIAEILIKANFAVEIWTLPQVEEVSAFDELDCDQYIVPEDCTLLENIEKEISAFNFAICNTVLTGHYARYFYQHNINHYWILREGKSLPDTLLRMRLDSLVLHQEQENILADSGYIRQFLYDTYNISVKVLSDFVEDSFDSLKALPIVKDTRRHFVFYGALTPQSGLDICIRAFLKLDPGITQKWSFHIIGERKKNFIRYWQPLLTVTENYSNIIWHSGVSYEKKQTIFAQGDFFIVPSLDDTSSRVLLEAAMLGKASIISEKIGKALTADKEAVMFFNSDDPIGLLRCLQQCITMPEEKIKSLGIKARQHYLENSTKEIFRSHLFNYLNKFSFNTGEKKLNKSDNTVIGMRKISSNTEEFFTKIPHKIEPKETIISDIREETYIIVPVYNGIEHLERLVPSLVANTKGKHRFIFIDDASNDYTKSWLKTNISPIENALLLTNEENLGFPGTVNKAVTYTENKNFVLLNTDTIVPENWLARLIAPLEADNTVATCTPLTSCAWLYAFPLLDNDILNKEFLSDIGLEKIDYACSVVNASPIEMPTANGFCMAISGEIRKKIGAFNHILYEKGYGEEADWCMRAGEQGWHHFCVPSLYVAHIHGGSFTSETQKNNKRRAPKLRSFMYVDQENGTDTFRKKYPFRNIFPQIFYSIPDENLQIEELGHGKIKMSLSCVNYIVNEELINV